MKDSAPFLIRDLEQLLDQTVVKDAVAQIMEKLEEAVNALPPASAELISAYFNGSTFEEIARANSVTPEQAREWIDRIKRELSQILRAKCLVKQ